MNNDRENTYRHSESRRINRERATVIEKTHIGKAGGREEIEKRYIHNVRGVQTNKEGDGSLVMEVLESHLISCLTHTQQSSHGHPQLSQLTAPPSPTMERIPLTLELTSHGEEERQNVSNCLLVVM